MHETEIRFNGTSKHSNATRMKPGYVAVQLKRMPELNELFKLSEGVSVWV